MKPATISYTITADDSGAEFDGELYEGLLHAVRHLSSEERLRFIENLRAAHTEIEGTNR
ncbi:hypothetical protein EC919_104180 [Pseudomonas graminis]|uniref:hypothetical protein n=1 Tax=Pseudomonas graminis TaxID=158627 RepID=UPI0010D998CE|nr:hypothetical protein [Pseudomonas graminis]TDV54444.1 hypothetical protein EC919_104180 [Pseudomonas graminis]